MLILQIASGVSIGVIVGVFALFLGAAVLNRWNMEDK